MNYQDIYVYEAVSLLARDDITVLDMRDELSREKGQLPGAQPASDTLINKLMRQRRNDPLILVYCYHGNSSQELCSFLAQLGLTQVYNLAGGWEAWEHWQQQQPPALTEPHRAWLQEQGFDSDDLNSRIALGMSPLMQAALKGQHALVDALLAAGADPRQVNDDEHHALWFACVNGDPALVARMIDCGSDINNRNVNGVTCAIYAASTGKLEILKTLVDAGADLGICTHDGVSALESASTLPVLRYLRHLIRQAG